MKKIGSRKEREERKEQILNKFNEELKIWCYSLTLFFLAVFAGLAGNKQPQQTGT